jgi:isopenicillin N synthase-like dioxygenase
MRHAGVFVLTLLRPDLAGLRQALTTSGAFYLADHGIDPNLLHQAFAAMADLCRQPASVHQRLLAAELPQMRGFSEIPRSGEYRQSFFCTTGLAEGPDAWPIPGNQLWPEEVPCLQQNLAALTPQLARATGQALALSLLALGAPAALVNADLLRPPGGLGLRLLRYPALPPDEQRPGVTPHSDRPPLTLIAQNDVGGLQWATRDNSGRPDQWFDLPPHPELHVVQVGDALSYWSQDLAVANIHRVTNTADRDRYSLAAFALPEPTTELRPWPEGPPARNPPVPFGQYLRDWLDSLTGEHIYQPPAG